MLSEGLEDDASVIGLVMVMADAARPPSGDIEMYTSTTLTPMAMIFFLTVRQCVLSVTD